MKILINAVMLSCVLCITASAQYMDTERQWEKLYGNRLFTLIEERPLAWFPVGVLERHGEHLPWGLDGDKAHLVCVRLAGKLGGVVLPTSNLAGVHGDPKPGQSPEEFRASKLRDADFMFGEDYLRTFLYQAYDGLANLGFRVIVAYTGHYPQIQMDIVRETAEAYTAAAKGKVVVIPFWEPLACGGGDHGAKWEGSIWAALVPGGVRMDSIVDYRTGRKGWYRGEEIKNKISAGFGEQAMKMVEDYLTREIDKAFVTIDSTGSEK